MFIPAPRLSRLKIDADKDWLGKRILNAILSKEIYGGNVDVEIEEAEAGGGFLTILTNYKDMTTKAQIGYSADNDKIIDIRASQTVGNCDIYIGRENDALLSGNFTEFLINTQRLRLGGFIQLAKSSPLSPSAGDIYFDDTEKKIKMYDGAEWKEIPRRWLYVEYNHPLVAVNVSGTTPYYFSTTSSSPVIVDFTYFDYGKVMANVRNIYGSSAQVIKRWIELQMATDTAGTPVYADLYNYTDDVQVAQVDTDINTKSNRVQIVLPELDESKVYVVRGWSSDGNAACVIGTVIFKQLIKFNEDEL